MVKPDDLRVRRTRKLIREAFISLLRTKRFEKISIQEISDKAMINRATFYAHYADKQDLYDSLIDNFLLDFMKSLDEGAVIEGDSLSVSKLENILSRFYDFILSNPEVTHIIIDRAQDASLRERFLNLLTENYSEFFEQLEVKADKKLLPTDFIMNYISSILIGNLDWWTSSTDKMKSRDFARLTLKLISNGNLVVSGIQIK